MPSKKIALDNLSKDQLVEKVLEIQQELEKERAASSIIQNDKLEALANLKSAKEYLENTEKMALLGEMSGNMAHEINNPLLVLNGYVSKLKRIVEKPQTSTDNMEKAIERIDSMARRIQHIIKGLLKFSRSNSASLEYSVVKVIELLSDTLILCDHKLKRAGIILTIEDFDKDLDLECAAVQLTQVIMNLIGNSYDAILNTAEPYINIKIIDLGEDIEIHVTDSGHGVKQELQEKIFTRGFTTKGLGVSTGLGLALSKELIDCQNGSLKLDTKCKNTRFVISMPKRRQEVKAI